MLRMYLMMFGGGLLGLLLATALVLTMNPSALTGGLLGGGLTVLGLTVGGGIGLRLLLKDNYFDKL